MRRILLTLTTFCWLQPAAAETVGACRFDRATLAFSGEPVDQARCLLRAVAKFGRVAREPAQLPASLTERIGKPVEVDRAALSRRLAEARIPAELARLDAPLSRGNGNAPGAPSARYFVIHDTSSPWFGDRAFPADMDVSDRVNRLAGFAGPNAVAHVFVNRRGEVLLGHDLSVPWRATKLETQVIGPPAKGLFLHVEFVQPRRRDPGGGARNDAIAAMPGFSDPQYDRLALLYGLASARAGRWLVPSFHAAIDEGLSDGHDDPQNFEMAKFDAALKALLSAVASRREGAP